MLCAAADHHCKSRCRGNRQCAASELTQQCNKLRLLLQSSHGIKHSFLTFINDLRFVLQLTITATEGAEATDDVLPVSYPNFTSMVQKGDSIFVGRYLVTGSEDSSLYLTVSFLLTQAVVPLTPNVRPLFFSTHTLEARAGAWIGRTSAAACRDRIPPRLTLLDVCVTV